MGQVKLSNLFLALAAGLDLVSCHRAARFTGPIKKNNFLNVSVKHLTKKTHIHLHARENFFNVSVKW